MLCVAKVDDTLRAELARNRLFTVFEPTQEERLDGLRGRVEKAVEEYQLSNPKLPIPIPGTKTWEDGVLKKALNESQRAEPFAIMFNTHLGWMLSGRARRFPYYRTGQSLPVKLMADALRGASKSDMTAGSVGAVSHGFHARHLLCNH